MSQRNDSRSRESLNSGDRSRASFSPRTFFRRVGVVAVGQLLANVLVGLTYVIGARLLGPQQFGEAATAIAVGVIGVVLYDFGVSGMLARDLAAGCTTVADSLAVARSKRRFVPVLVASIAGVSFFPLRSWVECVAFGLIAWAMWDAQVASSTLRGLEQFRPLVRNQLVGKSIGLLVSTIMLAASPDAGQTIFAGAFASGWMIEAILGNWVLRGKLGYRSFSTGLRELHRTATPYGLTSMSASAQQLDTPAVAAGAGVVQAGLYAGAGRLIGPLSFLATSLTSVAIPWLARAQNSPSRLRLEEKRVGRAIMMVALAPVLASGLGPILLPLVLGDQFDQSGVIFSILCMGAVFSTLVQGTAAILQARRAQGSVAFAVSLGLGVGILATYVLATIGGAVYAAAGLLISQALAFCLLHLKLRRLRRSTDS